MSYSVRNRKPAHTEKRIGGNVIFIDTENTFRPERVNQIAESMGVTNTDEILEKIFVCKTYNSGHLEFIATYFPLTKIGTNSKKAIT